MEHVVSEAQRLPKSLTDIHNGPVAIRGARRREGKEMNTGQEEKIHGPADTP